MRSLFFFLLAIFLTYSVFGQDDLMSMLEDETPEENLEIIATWKTMKLVNLHSTEMVKKNALDFRVAHRFGNLGTPSGGGPHNLYGLDNSSDIRISFDYGITKKWQVGVGRSKYNELIDASTKYKILSQKEKKVPISIVAFGNTVITPKKNVSGRYDDWQNRLGYSFQLVFARKFGDRISFEINPMVNHRNTVDKVVDGEGNTLTDENTLYSVGLGGRFMITKRLGLLIDYAHTFSEFRDNYKPKNYYDPLGIGVEIETGGHVFHITMTNAPGIESNNFIPETSDSWEKGGMKLGFNISRVFQF